MADPLPDPDTILSTMICPALDVLGDRAVRCEGEERLNYWSAFKRLFDVFPAKDVRYGRIHNRSMIGTLLVVLTQAHQSQKGDDQTHTYLPLPDTPFSIWEEDDWEMLNEYLQEIVKNLKRQDADAAPEDVENEAVNEGLAKTYAFTGKVEETQRMIMMNKVVAPIRLSLESQLDDVDIDGTNYPKLDASLVEKMWNNVLNEDEDIQELIVQSLFQASTATSGNRPKFKTIGELRKIFHGEPFEFNAIVNYIELTVENCYSSALCEPILTEYYFPNYTNHQNSPDDDSQESQEEFGQDRLLQVSPDVLSRLRDARQALRDEGRDPLQECIRLANAATRKGRSSRSLGLPKIREQSQERRRGSRLYKKRKTAVRLAFDDDNSRVDDESGAEASPGLKRERSLNLSTLPPQVPIAPPNSDEENTPSKKRRRESQQKKYDGKRGWTAEEKSAILQGVQKYGKGSWAMIKKKYDVLFELRTSGQIKDCFRSMMKRGEVPEELLDEPNNA